MVSPRHTAGGSARAAYLALALVALTLAVYWPVVRHDFVDFDDDKLIRLEKKAL